jgi:thiopeptide-type bacteriocin biosynthesis protein
MAGTLMQPTTPAQPISRATTLYRPLDCVMVRAPLLPVEAYVDLADPERQRALLADARVRRALAVGSTSLLAALDRSRQSPPTRRDDERMRTKLLRYLVRMSTRPTPFGLFAGIALTSWGERSTLRVRATDAASRMRPDMAWLITLVMQAERDLDVRRRLSLVANPLAVVEAGRITLAEPAPSGSPSAGAVSVRATAPATLAMELARTPVPHQELAERLHDAFPSAPPEKVDTLLAELWQQTFLLTDLRPPLTHADPAGYVAQRLADIPEAADVLTKLNAFRETAAEWDRLDRAASTQALLTLLDRAGIPTDGSKESPVQVDMAMSVDGRLASAVGEEAARAAELLLRLTPAPQGLASLTAYRQAFVNKYGQDREVPLLELLDPHRGLGPANSHGYAAVGPGPAQAERRARTLLQLACTALHTRQRVVELDEKLLSRLETWKPAAERAPLSVDINVLIGARSQAAIDHGDFTVVVGPNLGAQSAGRNLGRFAHLLGPGGPSALQAAVAEQRAREPDELWAEVVYLPSTLKSANVVIRPAVLSYEAVVGTTAGVDPSHVIPLHELRVGEDSGRLYVRWPRAGKRIRFHVGHMLNHHHAPAVIRFLSEVAHDGKAVFNSFDWGAAEGFPYLPRVQAGRVVLRPAQWRLHKDDWVELGRWRDEWDVPKHVCLSVGDNRLVLDLDHAAQAAQLEAELQKLAGEGASIVVQEVVPALEESWLAGPEGHYYSELVVSLVLGPSPKTAASVEPAVGARPSVEVGPDASRNCPPGSDWLFVKLYCPSHTEDDVIADSMRVFSGNAVAAGLAASSFFIRYSDPDPHIRLRFHGSADRLTSQLYPHLCEWAAGLAANGLCRKFVFDTYERELERFGGPEGMSVAEAIFAADSRAAAELVGCLKANGWTEDHTTLLVLTLDDLLDGLGLDAAARLRWYRSQTTAGAPDIGADYRRRKGVLRSLLADPARFLATQPSGGRIASILSARRDAVTPLGARLRELADTGVVGRSLETLCSSFLHLHINRVGARQAAPEHQILGLLARTRESLAKAPVSPADPAIGA